MSVASVRVATAAVRGWTRLYTCGLPKDARDARRDEIESDLWESTHDGNSDDAWLALHIWMRCAGGLLNDLRWRAAQVTDVEANAWRLAITLIFITLFGLWMVTTAILPAGQPRPPSPPRLDERPALVRQPPPPPPPPCLPASFKQDPAVPCSR
jgi:hypothetical protein